MKFTFLINLCAHSLAIITILYPLSVDALSHYWVGVPKSEYGEQFWDNKSLQHNQDGSIRVLSKFVPKSNSEITQDILYTMDINCSQSSFRDVAVGTNKFNEFENKNSKWSDPDGDALILSVINQVCTFSKNHEAS